MKKIKYISVILISAVFALTSCNDLLDESVIDDEMLITLKSSIPTSPLMAKSGALDYDSQVSGGLDLTMYRWDQGNSTDVTKLSALNAVLGGTPDPADGWKRSIHINPAQYYKDRTSQVGFMGFYPGLEDQNWKKNGTSYYTTDSQGRPTLTFDIDGSTDVMFSDFQDGTYETGVNTLTFNHALCKYDIYIYAADEDTKNQWGKVNDIVLMNLPDQLFVHFPKDFTDVSQSIEYTYTPTPADGQYTPTIISAEKELNNFVIRTPKLEKFTYIERQGSLFDGFDLFKSNKK